MDTEGTRAFRQRETRRRRRLLVLLAVASLLLVTGCFEAKVLDGVWETELPITFDEAAVGDSLPTTSHVKLVLGHYGPDVAGVVRFYEDDAMKDEWAPCPCRYVSKGDYDDGVLTFDISPCGEEDHEVSGDFVIDASGSILLGTFTVDGEDVAPEFELVLTGGEKSITKSLKRCPDDEPDE